MVTIVFLFSSVQRSASVPSVVKKYLKKLVLPQRIDEHISMKVVDNGVRYVG